MQKDICFFFLNQTGKESAFSEPLISILTSVVQKSCLKTTTSLINHLGQWFLNFFKPLPKSRYRLCLIKKFFGFQVKNSFLQWLLIIQNNMVLVLRYSPKNHILPQGDNLPPVWEPLT